MSRVDDLERLWAAAQEAAQLVSAAYAKGDYGVEYKGPGDPVTDADRRANGLICERLQAAFPGVPIVAEESDPSTYAGWESSRRALFVDPIDGTLEFVRRNGEFAVMLGLADAGAPVAGVVLAPVLGIGWAGAESVGAWQVGADGVRAPIAPTSTARMSEARVVASRSHRGPDVNKLIDMLGVKEVIPCGSAGIKAAYVACGRADLYAQPGRAGKRWDSCAPEAIVRAAGGRFTDVFGDPREYSSGQHDNERGFLVSNGPLHKAASVRIRALMDANDSRA